MTENESGLPHWDMTPVYPGLDSPEYGDGFRRLAQEIADLADLFDDHEVGVHLPAALDAATVAAFDLVLARLNAVLELDETLDAYVGAFVATNSRHALAQARRSEIGQLEVKLTQLGTRFTAWIGSLDVEALLSASGPAGQHAHALRRAAEMARHLMSPSEEALAADLSLTGSTAWAKLWSDVSSQLTAPVTIGGAVTDLPMSAVRNLANEADRELRRQAYEAELAAWQRAAVPLAAAMNGLKGEVGLLARRRSWPSALDTALFDNGIDHQILEAMQGAAREALPVFRRYLRAKAQALGLQQLAWYDLFAPVGRSTRRWGFEDARELILTQFGSYSARLRDLAARAFAEHWIDAEPRAGKVDGAFCMRLRPGESRILANFQPTLSGVSTLAHELGHAYHNLNLADRTPLQRDTPMVLAETSSIFCETIVRQAAQREADRQEQIAILESELRNATQVVVDIASRFQFEGGVFAQRAQRELGVDELCALMRQAQADIYGDGLDPSTLHPYMWAAKPHYYRIHPQFYNFPYCFGLLFGLGMVARYRQDPVGFRAGYDDLLSATGMADVAALAGRFGIDVRAPAFWRSSLDVIAADVERFEELVG